MDVLVKGVSIYNIRSAAILVGAYLIHDPSHQGALLRIYLEVHVLPLEDKLLSQDIIYILRGNAGRRLISLGLRTGATLYKIFIGLLLLIRHLYPDKPVYYII